MEAHDIEMVGEYCQSVLDHPIFRMLCNQFELSCLQCIQNSTPQQTAAREEAYHTFRGALEFLNFLHSFIEQKESVLNEPDQHNSCLPSKAEALASEAHGIKDEPAACNGQMGRVCMDPSSSDRREWGEHAANF